ncbi:MAG: cell division protein FtsA [Armatimonadetes bacterium]|nr:cell division protein FtsA [Armatimonadota bacterium]
MARSEIVVGLDVGTTKVCALVGEILGGRLEFLGHGVAPCSGVRKGRVVDLSATTAAIRAAVARVSHAAGVEIGAVILSVTGDHLAGENRQGVVIVGGGEVTEAHVRTARLDARPVGAPDRVVLHNRPRHYRVDGQPGIRHPLGMTARELAVETHLVTASAPILENLVRCVHRADLDVQEMVVSGLAAAYATLSETEWAVGTLVADIGGGTTDVVVCTEGSLFHTASLPVGGDHVTNDLSVGLRIPRADAEALKLRHGTARIGDAKDGEFVAIRAVGDPEPREVPHRIVAEIIEPRVRELLELVRAEMDSATENRVLVAKSAVLTGGGALLEGTMPLAREILGLPVRLGVPRSSRICQNQRSASLERPYYSVGVGLLLHALLRRGRPEGAPGPAVLTNGASPIAAAWERLVGWVQKRMAP